MLLLSLLKGPVVLTEKMPLGESCLLSLVVKKKKTGKVAKIHHVLDIKGYKYISITLVKTFGPKSNFFFQ